MTDKQIFDLINTSVETAVERYYKMTTTLVSGEMDSVRHEIKGVKEQFNNMNGQLKDVCKWKSEQEGAIKAREDGINNHLKVATIIIAFIGMASGMFFGFRKMGDEVTKLKTQYELNNNLRLEERGFSPYGPARGDTINDSTYEVHNPLF